MTGNEKSKPDFEAFAKRIDEAAEVVKRLLNEGATMDQEFNEELIALTIKYLNVGKGHKLPPNLILAVLGGPLGAALVSIVGHQAAMAFVNDAGAKLAKSGKPQVPL